MLILEWEILRTSTSMQRRQWQPTPVVLLGKSHGWGPGLLQSMGSGRIRHDWVISLSPCTFMHWRRKWQPNPVFWPGESQGQWSLMGCPLLGSTESDTTEGMQQQQPQLLPCRRIRTNFWYRKYREIHISWWKFVPFIYVWEIERIPYFLKKEWWPDFHL